MMETLERLRHFHGLDSKGIVWEHNSHIGDARATDSDAGRHDKYLANWPGTGMAMMMYTW